MKNNRIPQGRGSAAVVVGLVLIGGVGLVLIVMVLCDSCLTTDYP